MFSVKYSQQWQLFSALVIDEKYISLCASSFNMQSAIFLRNLAKSDQMFLIKIV